MWRKRTEENAKKGISEKFCVFCLAKVEDGMIFDESMYTKVERGKKNEVEMICKECNSYLDSQKEL